MTDETSGHLDTVLRLDGKTAIITGAAMNIGREIARVFAAQGASVVIADIDGERGEQVAAEIRGRGGQASFVRTDVSRSPDIQAMIQFAVESYGRVDILINNAHWERHGTVVDLEEADWDRSMDVLLKALYTGCKYAIPEMRKVGGGAIVNLSSVHAYHVSDAYVTYQTAKAAILQFTRQVAWDFGPSGIRCNAICPGSIWPPEHAEKAVAADRLVEEEATLLTPMRRMGHPRDIAHAALFLCSDLASWLTGQALTVDGGEFMAFSTTGLGRMKEWLRRHPERLA